MYMKTRGVLGRVPTSYIYDSLSLLGLEEDQSVGVKRKGGVTDSVAEIGQALWKKAPAGVIVAIHNPDEPEQMRRGIEFAKREDAIGVKAKKIDAAELIFGKAIADSRNIVSQLTKLGTALKAAVERVQAPQGITPLAGTGPYTGAVYARRKYLDRHWWRYHQ
jgi:hypothetical protein